MTFAVEALLPIHASARAFVRAELCHGLDCTRVDLDSGATASRTPGKTSTSAWSSSVPEQSAYLVAEGSEARWKLHFGLDGTKYPAGDPWHLQVVSLASGRVLVDVTDSVPAYEEHLFSCTLSPGSLAELDAGAAIPDTCEESSASGSPALPVLHYGFEGDTRNTGTLGPDHDGLLHGMTYVSGKRGQGLVTGTLDSSYVDVSLSDFESKAGFTVGLWFQPGDGISSELLTGMGILVNTISLGSVGSAQAFLYRKGSPENAAQEPLTFHFAPSLWHHLALRSEALDGSVDVFLDGQLVGVVPNEERIPLWLDAKESLTLGVGPGIGVDELVVFDHALEDSALCTDALGGRWCADVVCGLP